MHVDLAALLDQLRQDHRNMSTLLDLVEREVLCIDAGGDPDLELLADAMRYLTVHSDAIHHPREDLVYREMRAAGDSIAAGLERIEPDHRRLAELGMALRGDVEAALAGAAVARERLLQDAIDYVRRLRAHMDWEERDLLPRADELAAAGRCRIDTGSDEAGDPLFGALTSGPFERLYVRITRTLV